MFKIIQKFFQDLTHRNWGAPWHAVIVLAGVPTLTVVFGIWLPLYTAFGLSVALLFISLLLYGFKQLRDGKALEAGAAKTPGRSKQDFKEDFFVELISFLYISFIMAFLIG